MNVRFHKAFAKDLTKISDRVTRQKIKKAILKAEKAQTIDEINLKAMQRRKERLSVTSRGL